MHYEVLVEDQSGAIAMGCIIPKILGSFGKPHTWRIIAYKGVGRIPKNLRGKADPSKRILLAQLPRLLKGYGKSLPKNENCVIVVADLDDRDCLKFKEELTQLLHQCNPPPRAKFRIAVEELEAWFLGDPQAILSAYPKTNKKVLKTYRQDSICGTWETLADAVFPGGAGALKKAGWPLPGKEKCKWAQDIAPHMDVEKNQSKSFQAFRDCLRTIAGQ